MLIITSYDSPDLDGIACAIAYSELLTKLGKKNTTLYFGDLGPEVDFVKKFTKYFPVKKHQGPYKNDDTFILVDTSDPEALDPSLPLNKIVEVYDHRKLAYTEKFPNAKCNIELVGSCSTLIAEEFRKKKITPSKASAIYLYSAIVSNTINFKNLVTTKRDVSIAKWLLSIAKLPKNYSREMFEAKSDVNAKNIYQLLYQDFATQTFNEKRVGIAQLEVVDLEKKIKSLGSKFIKTIAKLKNAYKSDYILFTGIDVIRGYNIFFFVDEESRKLFSKALKIPNLYSGYKTKKIIMRKQIGPKVKEVI